MRLVRIWWETTNTISYGKPIPLNIAEAWLRQVRKQYPNIKYWIEEVPY